MERGLEEAKARVLAHGSGGNLGYDQLYLHLQGICPTPEPPFRQRNTSWHRSGDASSTQKTKVRSRDPEDPILEFRWRIAEA